MALVLFTVKFQRQTLPVELPRTATVRDLKEHLRLLLGVPAENQKLLLKATLSDDLTLEESGVVDNCRVLLLASSADDVHQVATAVAKPTIPAPTISVAKESQRERQRRAALEEVRIHRLEALDLPEKEFAIRLLEKIRDDLGIKEILKKHGWHVRVLKELTPLNLKIDGYNRNRGEEITVKLRNLWDQTFKSWPDIMNTMLHELAHCDHSEHDANFHQLNRQLHKEWKALDWTKGSGAKVGGDLDAYNPNPTHMEDSLAETDSVDWRVATKKSSGQRLGGGSEGLIRILNLAPAQMAGLMAELRLTQQEREQVEACGCGHRVEAATAPPMPCDNPKPSVAVEDVDGNSGAAPMTLDGADTIFATEMDNVPSSSCAPSPSTSSSHPSPAAPELAPASLAPNPQVLITPSCPVCSLTFQPNDSERYISNHVDQCLRPPVTEQLAKSSPAPACPLCGMDFPSEASERFMTNHVERCLTAA